MSRNNLAAQKYGSMDLQSKTDHASPHQLIQMLIDGAIVRSRAAIGHMQRNETAQKAELIGKAISIIDGLRGSLDMSKGGDISSNLDDLYIYMNKRLMEANASNKTEPLVEVCAILEDIRSAWGSIKDTPAAQASSVVKTPADTTQQTPATAAP